MKKILAITLVLATVFGLVACGGSGATASKTFSREELQQIVVETALAYLYQNPDVQYDSSKVANVGTQRLTSGDAPEIASPDTQIYSVCSDYMYDIYYNAFGYKINGSPKGVLTNTLVALRPEDTKMVIFASGPNKNEEEAKVSMAKMRELLQVGDIIVGYGDNAGHAMLYVGDCLGDGVNYAIHCWGKKIDRPSGEDEVETKGAIYLQPVEDLCFNTTGKPNYYLGKDSHCNVGLSIIRPFEAEDFVAEPTEWAKSRMQYRGLQIDRELDRSAYHGVQVGEELPVTVTVTNHGKEAYTALPITETVPEGQTVAEGSAGSAKVNGNTLTWTVDVPAGEAVSVSYKLKVAGTVGDKILLPAGSVAAIPTREITVAVGGKPVDDEQAKALVAAAKKMAEEQPEAEQTAVFNKLYQDAFGVELGLPETTEKLVEAVSDCTMPQGFDAKMYMAKTNPTAEEKKFADMVIPKHVNGYYAYYGISARAAVMEFDGCSDRYEPGDLFIGFSDPNKTVLIDKNAIDYFVYLGNYNVLYYNAKKGYSIVKYGSSIGYAMKYNLFIGLRPTLGAENLLGK